MLDVEQEEGCNAKKKMEAGEMRTLRWVYVYGVTDRILGTNIYKRSSEYSRGGSR